MRKRPYLSFRPSKVYGDTLNDTEVLITRVLCATLTWFTALQALGVVSKNSDNIDAIMNLKYDVVERWELERTLDRDLMTEEEKVSEATRRINRICILIPLRLSQARWEVDANHKHPSLLRIFGLVIACVCGVAFFGFGFCFAVINSASNDWAQWLWFSAAMLGGFSVDTYAIQCLSGEGGDSINGYGYIYSRGFLRSTSSRQLLLGEEEEEIEVAKDEENPQVVTSPVHEQEDEPDHDEIEVEIELTEAKKPNPTKRPSMIKNPSSKPSVSVSVLMTKFEKLSAL